MVDLSSRFDVELESSEVHYSVKHISGSRTTWTPITRPEMRKSSYMGCDSFKVRDLDMRTACARHAHQS